MIISTLVKTGAVISTSAIAALNVVDPITAGKDVGGFTTAEVLGVVSVSCVIAMVAQYWHQNKERVESRKAHGEHTDRLYNMIESSAQAARENAVAVRGQSDALRELVISVSKMNETVVKCAASK